MELLQLLGDSALAGALRQPGPLYPLLNAAHILSFAVLVGSIAVLDLRLLGLFSEAPLQGWARPLARVAAAGLLAAVSTGFLLFSVKPADYAANPAFLFKLALVALGIFNALALRASPSWRLAEDSGRVGGDLKWFAALSLATWISAVVAGRWIAFYD